VTTPSPLIGGPEGGTMFADTCAAYDALPPAMKARLAGLTGRHGYTSGPDSLELDGKEYVCDRNRGRFDRLHPAV